MQIVVAIQTYKETEKYDDCTLKMQFFYVPPPMAPQVRMVMNISVHFWHPKVLCFFDFRSQHRVIKYKSRRNSEKMRIPAGIDARIVRL
jgi:hypothetical protein